MRVAFMTNSYVEITTMFKRIQNMKMREDTIKPKSPIMRWGFLVIKKIYFLIFLTLNSVRLLS